MIICKYPHPPASTDKEKRHASATNLNTTSKHSLEMSLFRSSCSLKLSKSIICRQLHLEIALLIRINIPIKRVATVLTYFHILLPTTVICWLYNLLSSSALFYSNIFSSCSKRALFSSCLTDTVIAFILSSCCDTLGFKISLQAL